MDKESPKLCGKSLKCPTCKKSITNLSNLRQHMKIHSGEKLHKCPTCEMSFAQSSNLNKHMKIHSGEKPFQCPTCKKLFVKKHHLQRHTKSCSFVVKRTPSELDETKNSSIKMTTCLESAIRDSVAVPTDIRSHSVGTHFKCQTCGKLFTRCDHLLEHMKIHSGGMPYKCLTCAKSVIPLNDLKEQMINISYAKRSPSSVLLCETGSEEEFSEKKLSITNIDTEKEFKETITANSITIQIHKMEIENKRISKVEKCFIPNEVNACVETNIRVSGHLQRHTRNIAKQNSSKCIFCDKMFRNMNNLRNHMRMHSKEKQYKCPTCKRSFSNTSNMKKHINIHFTNTTSVRNVDIQHKEPKFTLVTQNKPELTLETHENTECPPFTCNKLECTMLTHKKSEYAHINDNKEVFSKLSFGRNCKCPNCEKTFVSLSNLEAHMRIHSRERQYKCTRCDRLFTQAGSMRAHMQSHSKERPYKCPTCGRTFTQIKTMNRHIKNKSCKGCFECQPRFRCPICSKFFRYSWNVNEHVKSHSGEKPYHCQTCSRTFTLSRTLKRHMMTHLKCKDYKRNITTNWEIQQIRPELNSDGIKKEVMTDSSPLTKTYQDFVTRTYIDDEKLQKKPNETYEISSRNMSPWHRHMRMYLKEKPITELIDHRDESLSHQMLKCITCSCEFETDFLRLCHMDFHERNDLNLVVGQKRHFGCSVCFRSFKTKQATVRHFKSH